MATAERNQHGPNCMLHKDEMAGSAVKHRIIIMIHGNKVLRLISLGCLLLSSCLVTLEPGLPCLTSGVKVHLDQIKPGIKRLTCSECTLTPEVGRDDCTRAQQHCWWPAGGFQAVYWLFASVSRPVPFKERITVTFYVTTASYAPFLGIWGTYTDAYIRRTSDIWHSLQA